MIIELELARETYEKIKEKAKKKNGKIIIIVSFDIDALCSLRILVALLRADNIRYEVIPVMNYSMIEKKFEDLRSMYENNNQKDISAFFMINCGGSKDMTQCWFTNYDIECIIVDTHRPINHKNVNINRSIILINDNQYELENCPTNEDFDQLQNDQEEIEEDFEEEEVEDEDRPNRKRIQKKKENLDTIEEECDVDRLIEDFVPKRSTKSALKDEKMLKRMIRIKKMDKVKKYYGGSYFGFPAAYCFYRIAKDLHREDSQILWLLIIASTEHYLQSHISQSMYETLYNECHSEVLRLEKSHSGMNNKYGFRLKREANEDDDPNKKEEKDNYDFSDVKVKTQNKDIRSIIVDPDYRLVLYRHWNLFDSFIYSNYPLGQLVTWKEQGKEEIKKLLALIGIPIDEAKQKYTYMKNDFKTIFREKIIDISNKFDLKDFIFYSFLFQLDQKTQLSASDFVYCLASLLEYPFSFNHLEGENNIGEVDFSVKNDEDRLNEEPINDSEKEMRKENKFDNFWACYDFLSFKSLQKTKQVINLAIKFQLSLIKNGTKIIDNKLVNATEYYRYAIVKIDLDEQKYFQNAISLERLALFTMNIYQKTRNDKKHSAKPFILALLNTLNNTYMVAGVMGNARTLDQEKNEFSFRFKMAANKIQAPIKLECFDDCIIEIPKDYISSFLEDVLK
jgi:cell division control protein 45